MRKRLTKIFGTQIISQFPNLPEGVTLNVVLKNGHTFFGKPEAVTPDTLHIRDNRNHPHAIPVTAIDLIIYDTVNAY